MCTPKDRRQIPCLRLQPFPSSVGKPQLVSTRFALGFCCRSLISLVSSRLQGNKLHLHCTTPGTSSSTAAGKLQLHWPAAQPLGFGAHTKRNPPQLSALDKPLPPIPRPQERSTHSQPNGRSPLSRSEHLLSRGRLVTSCCWFPFPFTNRRFLNRIDSCPSLPREEQTTQRVSWLAGRGTGTRMPTGPQTQRPSTPKSTALVRHMRHGRPRGGRSNWKSPNIWTDLIV